MTTETIGNAVFVVHDGVIVAAPNALSGKAAMPTTSTSLSEDYHKSVKHVYWGENDNFPNELQADLDSDTVLKPGLRLKTELYYAGGLIYGKYVLNGDEIVDWKRCYVAEIEKFIRDNFLAKQYYQIFFDLVKYQISFPQFILSVDGKKIIRLTTEFTKAAHCRMGRLVNGYPQEIYLNADFGTNDYRAENTKTLKCAPQYGTVEWIRNNIKGGERFVIPVEITDGYRQYYPEPDWNTARKSNWVQIARDIAVFNKALVNNKLTILYHAETHPKYWESLFGEQAWNAFSPEQKVEKIKEWAKALAKSLKGAENVGNVLTNDVGTVPGTPQETYPLLKITKVDREIDFKEGAYLPTSKESSEHKTFALGLHSDITGITPGGGMGAGSGSNSRVAFNQRAMLAKAVQDMAARIMYIVAEYNGWDPQIEFTFETSLITTLDAGAESMKATHNPQPEKK